MTDPQPDPLFDALRDQLADYGQEPPAHLWAGIRQQLPPPVALPQRRRRRALSVALLALLLLVTGVVGWQAWELSPLRRPSLAGRAGTHPVAATVASGAASRAATAPTAATAPATATATMPAPAAAAVAPTPAAAAAAVAAVPTGTPAATEAPVTTSAANATKPAPVAATSGTVAAAPTAIGRPAGPPLSPPAGPTRTSRPVLATTRPARAGLAAAAIHPAAPAGARARHTAPAAASARPSKHLAPATMAAVAASSTPAGASRAARAASAPSSPAPTPPAATATAARAARQARAAAPSPTAALAEALVDTHQASAASPAATPSVLASTSALPDHTATEAARAMAYDQLALRQPTLPAPLPLPLPGLPAEPIKRSMAVPPPPARWVTQTLFGPALTGVRLGTAPKAAGNVPASFVTMVTDEEQATRSGSVQVSLRRNFKAHWSLSAGLGAAEYATESTLRQRYFPNIASNLDPSAVRTDSFVVVSKYRKSYQFFSLPVRLGYAWQPSLRWQLGLLAGVEATYLFHAAEITSVPLMTGTFASTSAATRQWGLGSSLGVEARYHLSPRCELLAQPTFTYLLTPLNRERVGEAPRHPWGAALLLGVAYELR